MVCPTCLMKTAYNGNPYRPFCSERCKLIDLGKWASEAFRLPDLESTSGIPDSGEGDDEQ